MSNDDDPSNNNNSHDQQSGSNHQFYNEQIAVIGAFDAGKTSIITEILHKLNLRASIVNNSPRSIMKRVMIDHCRDSFRFFRETVGALLSHTTLDSRLYHFATSKTNENKNNQNTNVNTNNSSNTTDEKDPSKEQTTTAKNDHNDEQTEENGERIRLPHRESFLFSIIDTPALHHRKVLSEAVRWYSGATTGLLVVPAAKGEFEVSMEKRFFKGGVPINSMIGHAVGITRWVVAVTKMDHKSVDYSRERYDEVTKEVFTFLKMYTVAKRVIFVPAIGNWGEGDYDSSNNNNNKITKENQNIFPLSNEEKKLSRFAWYYFSTPPSQPDDKKEDNNKSTTTTATTKPNTMSGLTLIEALEETARENHRTATKPIKATSLHVENPNMSEAAKNRFQKSVLKPVAQEGIPLRVCVLQNKFFHVEKILRKNGLSEYLGVDGSTSGNNSNNNNDDSMMNCRSSYKNKISELVLVKVVAGALKIGSYLAFEPGKILRRVVSIGHTEIEYNNNNSSDDAKNRDKDSSSPTTKTVFTILDDNNNNTVISGDKQNNNIEFSTSFSVSAPAAIVVLGLSRVTESERLKLLAEKDRSEELEFSGGADDEIATAVQNHNHSNKQAYVHRRFKRQYDVIMGWSKDTKKRQASNRIKKELVEPKNFFPPHQQTTTTTTPALPLSSSSSPAAIISSSTFQFEIKKGSIASIYLHPDAPRCYYAQNSNDCFYGQIKIMKIANHIKTGYSPVIHCGANSAPCRIEFLSELDKRTGKDVVLKEDEKPKTKFKSAELAFVKYTPVYPSKPIVVDPLFFEGRGSNTRGILARLVMNENRHIACVGAVRAMWALRRWIFLIRYFGKGKSAEAFQIWNVLVSVGMFLSWRAQ